MRFDNYNFLTKPILTAMCEAIYTRGERSVEFSSSPRAVSHQFNNNKSSPIEVWVTTVHAMESETEDCSQELLS